MEYAQHEFRERRFGCSSNDCGSIPSSDLLCCPRDCIQARRKSCSKGGLLTSRDGTDCHGSSCGGCWEIQCPPRDDRPAAEKRFVVGLCDVDVAVYRGSNRDFHAV